MTTHTPARPYRLFRQLATTLGIAMIVTGLVSLGLNYQYVRTHFRQEEEEEIASITRSLRLTIENYVNISSYINANKQSASVLDHPSAKVKLQDFLHPYTELPDVISATVIAPDGRIIAYNSHSDDSAPAASTNPKNSIAIAPELALSFQRLVSSNTEHHTEHYIELTLNGKPVLAHAVPLDTAMFATTATRGLGWLVVVLDLNEMNGQIRLFLLKSLAIHLVTIAGLIGILSWVAQQALQRPLQQLNQAIQASKDSGVFSLPSSMPNNEVGFLARTLDAALQARRQAERSLHQQTERLQQQNYILNQLAKDPTLYTDYRSAVRGLTEAVVKTLDVERASVWLYTDDRSRLECVDLFERSPRRHSAGIFLAVADYPQYFRALEETEFTIAAHDAHRDPRTCEFSVHYLTPLGITSMLDSPIRSGGQTIGVLCIEQVGVPRQWSLEDEQFARAITDLTALALETCDRLHAENALRQSELTNRALLRAIPDLLIHMRQDGTYLSVQRSEHVHLYNPNHNYVGSKIYDVLPPEYAHQRMRYVHLALQTGQPQVYDYAIEVDGSLRYEEARVVPCGQDDVLIIVRDVSDRHQAEQQIRQQSAELEAALEELRQTQAQIVQAEKMS
ncbi:MAG: GAF domain-containing protein, partial [Cyanobacteria bacterium]|nr:GAF domain-containing protein [Cyanobacteriota bacterium]MDW8201567.1 GAF domain-containing protein [Cyanobacteriota bacterium SKYGB_h_bin112]